MIYDKDFLTALDTQQHHETFARVTTLTFDEHPIECIEGKVTTGSINIDGNSAVRRTCSLTIVKTEDVDINWAIKTKFTLEIGLKNTINTDYPDIVWFPQGLYVITAFNITHSTSGCTISISGKDKMCFLNGNLGGALTASIDFGAEEYYDKGTNTTTYTKLPIKKILTESVHFYAKEPYSNIIINDLDEIAAELLEYRGDTPLYLFYNTETNMFTNFTVNGDFEVYKVDDLTASKLSEFQTNGWNYDPRVEIADYYSNNITKVVLSIPEDGKPKPTEYTVSKIEYGQTVGYKFTDLTYAGDLISSIGENLTSIFDKIVKMLGAYEYFYDLDGHFVFQRKKNYIQNTWNNLTKDSNGDYYSTDRVYVSQTTYNFNDSNLIASYQKQPQLNNLRNDFSIWGERETVSGVKVPIHYRYAIDRKPTQYTSLSSGITYIATEEQIDVPEKGSIYKTDWRELIYQMAVDYYKFNQEDNYPANLAKANPELCANGETGYEQYYSDIQGFWRELYDPEPKPNYVEYEMADLNKDAKLFITDVYKEVDINDVDDLEDVIVIQGDAIMSYLDSLKIEDWDSVYANYYIPGPNGTMVVITENTKNFVNITDLYQLVNGEYKQFCRNTGYEGKLYIRSSGTEKISVKDIADETIKALYYTAEGYNEKLHFKTKTNSSINNSEGYISTEEKIVYYYEQYDYIIAEDDVNKSWSVNIIDNPALLNFWFDFLDSESELGKFSISNIGDRTKVINDSNIKAIYFREVPNLIFMTEEERKKANYSSGYTPVQINGTLENMFSISSQGKSAQDELDDLLYNYSYCIENITLSSVPIYHLEPNTRIAVSDIRSGIDGEYIISKMAISLTYNGMMTITASKAPDRFN